MCVNSQARGPLVVTARPSKKTRAMSTLDSLPTDALSFMLERCSCRSLARLALTNRWWASRVMRTLLTWWNDVRVAYDQVQSAQTLDELDALLGTFKRDQKVMGP